MRFTSPSALQLKKLKYWQNFQFLNKYNFSYSVLVDIAFIRYIETFFLSSVLNKNFKIFFKRGLLVQSIKLTKLKNCIYIYININRIAKYKKFNKKARIIQIGRYYNEISKKKIFKSVVGSLRLKKARLYYFSKLTLLPYKKIINKSLLKLYKKIVLIRRRLFKKLKKFILRKWKRLFHFYNNKKKKRRKVLPLFKEYYKLINTSSLIRKKNYSKLNELNFIKLLLKSYPYFYFVKNYIEKIAVFFYKNSSYINYCIKSFILIYKQNNVRAHLLVNYAIAKLKRRYSAHSVFYSLLSLLGKYTSKKIIKGYKCIMQGRFSRRDRAVYLMKNFKISFTKLKKVDFYYKTIVMKYGLCAIKIWLSL